MLCAAGLREGGERARGARGRVPNAAMERTPDAQPNFRVLLGVMSNPTSPRLRNQLRDWYSKFSSFRQGADVRYIFGSSFYANESVGMPADAPAEPPARACHTAAGERVKW